MKQIDLEMKFKKIGKEIEKKQLIKTYKEIAMNLGKIVRQDECSAHTNTDRIFKYEDLKILYNIHGWGNEDILVQYKGTNVFSASKIISQAKNIPMLPVVISEGYEYQINRFFQEGDWRDRLLDIYSKMQADVPQDGLKRIKTNFPKISED
ncbi:MAG: hypothetical protein ISS23_03180 [Nanoarchaeota archaeon]|nr:hypothetical protein [Nanoarchaeota archaeon]